MMKNLSFLLSGLLLKFCFDNSGILLFSTRVEAQDKKIAIYLINYLARVSILSNRTILFTKSLRDFYSKVNIAKMLASEHIEHHAFWKR